MAGMNDPFIQSLGGQGTMFTGLPINYPQMFNLGGAMGMQGTNAMALNMLMQPLMGSMIGNRYVPAQFQPQTNFYNQYRDQAQFMMQRQVMQHAAELDRQTYQQMFRGMAHLAGTPFGAREAAASEMMARDLSGIMPFLAPMAPELFDRLHGSRGSALIMGQQMNMGARYAMDPVTGMRGMSLDSVNDVTRRVYQQMYGPDKDISSLRGLTAGRAGQLYDEMQRRGLMGMGRTGEEGISFLAKEQHKSLDAMKNMPDISNQLRDLEANRIVDKLKDMSKAVAAMQDIFGEMGRPDAPMTELINGLQMLTQNGLQVMSPDKIERMVRSMSNMARNSGMDMTNMMRVVAGAATRTDQLGLDRSFAPGAGMAGVAFAEAFGRQLGGMRTFGLMDKDKALAIGTQLQANAAASPAAQQLATVMRLGDEFGAFDTKGNTDAARIYQAVSRGDNFWVDNNGQRRSVYLQPGTGKSFTDVMRSSGVNVALAERLRMQPSANMPTIQQHGIDTVVRSLQGQIDIAPKIFQELAAAMHQGAGNNEPLSSALRVASAQVAKTFLDMSPAEAKKVFGDRDVSPITDKMISTISALGIKVTDPIKAMITQQAHVFMGNMEERNRQDPGMRNYGRFVNTFAAMNTYTLNEARVSQMEADLEGRFQSSFAVFGRAGPMQRIADALMHSGSATTINDILGQAMGWQPEETVRRVTAGPLGQLTKEMEDLSHLDPNKAKARAAQILGKAKQTPAEIAELKKMAMDFGVSDPRDLLRLSGRQLGIQARNNTLNRLSPLIAKSAAWLNENGLIATQVSTMDLNRASAAMEGGDSNATQLAQHLAEQVLLDDKALGTLGKEGLTITGNIRDRSRQLQALADKHTGGDVKKLLAMKDAGGVGDVARAYQKEILGNIKKMGKSINEGHDLSKEQDKGFLEKLKGIRDNLKMGGGDAIREMLKLAGLDSRAGVVFGAGEIDAIGSKLGSDRTLQDLLPSLHDLQEQAIKKAAGGNADKEAAIRKSPAEIKKAMQALLAAGHGDDAKLKQIFDKLSGGKDGGGLIGLLKRGAMDEASVLKALQDISPNAGKGGGKKDVPLVRIDGELKMKGDIDILAGTFSLHSFTGATA